MSLLSRVEKAQQAEKAKQAESAWPGGSSPDTALPGASSPDGTPRDGPPPKTTRPAGPSPATALVPVPDTEIRAPRNPVREEMLQTVRLRLQAEAIQAFNTLLDAPEAEVRSKAEAIADRVVRDQGYAITREERMRLVQELIDEVTGFGPLEPYLRDPTITEVMVNGPSHVYIERKGKIQRVDSTFLNDEHVLRIIDRIIAPMGRRIDDSSPRVDARLPDGSRVNAIIEPLSLIGPVITVRKFSATPYTVDDLISFGTATPEMFEFLRCCVEARLNLFVSGGTGSGKTTTLNVLSSFIPNDERIVTIEDAAELQLMQEHVITLESRPPNLEGEGEITIRGLLRNAMHMRPDRVIVGECRAGEALDMLQAMTTGHDGSLSTGHANSPKDMLRRLETMVLMTGYQLPLRAIREQIASAVDLIVHTARLKDGSRRVTNITEVYGIEDEEILTQDIFVFEQTGVIDGRIVGELKPTGIRPTFMDQFARNGVELPPGDFGIPAEDPTKPTNLHALKGRWGGERKEFDASRLPLGFGRAVRAGGMIYVSAVGPVDHETGRVLTGSVKEHTRQCLRNLKAKLEEEGSGLDKVVWANWSLRDPGDFDSFNEEWVEWFPAEGPVGQQTLMPAQQRRAGFRVSIGVIAQA
jgi:pilus assembly protein CpaF